MTEKEKTELKERIAALEQKVEMILAERQRGLEAAARDVRRNIGLRP